MITRSGNGDNNGCSSNPPLSSPPPHPADGLQGKFRSHWLRLFHVEIVSVLYSHFLKFDPRNPADPHRDYMILSKGHGVMAVYACFKELGWLPQSAFENYFQDGSMLPGLCEAKIPGLEVSSGSLGHGLPIATGIALGLKILGRHEQKVYCIIGDGEMNEGTVWEAFLFAAHNELDNLTVIVDANGFQAMGLTDAIMNLEPMKAKFESFGFETRECDGHDPKLLISNLSELKSKRGKPQALIARTIKGKGITYMENNNEWHYRRINAEQLSSALKELEAT